MSGGRLFDFQFLKCALSFFLLLVKIRGRSPRSIAKAARPKVKLLSLEEKSLLSEAMGLPPEEEALSPTNACEYFRSSSFLFIPVFVYLFVCVCVCVCTTV